MECSNFRKDDVDVEGQGPTNDGTGSDKKDNNQMTTGPAVNHPLMMKNIISKTKKSISETPAWLIQYVHWDVAFLVVCVVAVAADPLFFYLPVIKELRPAAQKCIRIDKTLKIIAICVRSFLDLVALGDLVTRKISKCPGMKCSDYVINILSILPVHQVLMPIIFSEILSDSKIPHIWKFLNAVVLLQYVPRIFRIYRLWKIVNETIIVPKDGSPKVNNEGHQNDHHVMIPPKGFIVMKGGFNLFLYLLASHAVGAFWYFFSIQRETTCWHESNCYRHGQCNNDISLECYTGLLKNYTLLKDFCSIEKPNMFDFNFGIFEEARQSGILLASTDFPQKAMFCFWWGLRNLSSLGQNLETSSYYWENCFTVLISIFGLLLFLYFIGNLQVYMQRAASDELEEIKSRWLQKKSILKTKLDSIEDWIHTIGLPNKLEKEIVSSVTPILEDDENNHDAKNPFGLLSPYLKKWIKLHLICLPRLTRLPIFENLKDHEQLKEITYKYIEQVQYNENKVIVKKGEQLNEIIFVVKGHVCTFTSNDHGDKTESCHENCDLIGGHELVQWVMESPRKPNPPSSTRNLKCHTKVEAFRLKAGDLKHIYDAGENLASSETSHSWTRNN